MDWDGFRLQVQKQETISASYAECDDLIDQFLAVYDKLDEDLRADIPLKRVWTVASNEAEQGD